MLQTGPVYTRLDRLHPIGPRAIGGPALRLQTYTNCFHSAGTGPRVHFDRGPHCQQKSEMRDFERSLIIIYLLETMVIVFRQCVA